MRKRHILGFFDELSRTPAFLFLCAMFLCGAAAGALTGLRAAAQGGAQTLASMLAALPAHLLRSALSAMLWLALPLVCGLLRPASLFLAALAAARGFVLALTAAVALGDTDGLLLSLCATGLPALLSVPALLASCAMVWQAGETSGRYSLRTCRAPYVVCLALAVCSALLRAALAVVCKL